MPPDKAPTTTQTVNTVASMVSSRVPPGWSVRRIRSPGRGRGEPTFLRIRPPAGDTLDFQIVRADPPTPRSLIDTVEQRFTGGGKPVLIVATYLSQRAREVLNDRRVSYGDATGNVRLESDEPPFFLETVGASTNPWTTTQPLQSLRGRGAAHAIRALVDFAPPFGVRDLSDRSGASLGSLSRVMNLLDREALITREPRGPVTEVDVAGVIRRWTQDYDFRESNRVISYLEPRGIPAIKEKLTGASWRYAATGSFAAQEFAPIAPARLAAVYVDDAALASEKLGVAEIDTGANLLLIEPFDGVVFDRVLERDGLVVVNPTQLSTDLLTGPGRAPSEGEELLRWMEEQEDAWRA